MERLLHTALNMRPSYRAQGDSFLLYNGGNNKRKDKHKHSLMLLLERRCVGKNSSLESWVSGRGEARESLLSRLLKLQIGKPTRESAISPRSQLVSFSSGTGA